ncbi:MAG: hypothetical protein H6R37_275, partial [Deltaproteobacteria bacterium]|nr:hypothetical protein [Deltaproteobacteria bacterium]
GDHINPIHSPPEAFSHNEPNTVIGKDRISETQNQRFRVCHEANFDLRMIPLSGRAS